MTMTPKMYKACYSCLFVIFPLSDDLFLAFYKPFSRCVYSPPKTLCPHTSSHLLTILHPPHRYTCPTYSFTPRPCCTMLPASCASPPHVCATFAFSSSSFPFNELSTRSTAGATQTGEYSSCQCRSSLPPWGRPPHPLHGEDDHRHGVHECCSNPVFSGRLVQRWPRKRRTSDLTMGSARDTPYKGLFHTGIPNLMSELTAEHILTYFLRFYVSIP